MSANKRYKDQDATRKSVDYVSNDRVDLHDFSQQQNCLRTLHHTYERDNDDLRGGLKRMFFGGKEMSCIARSQKSERQVVVGLQ